MKILKKSVFEKVNNPQENREEFNALPKVEQLKWLNAYKEYVLENKIYEVVKKSRKSVHDVFYYNNEVDAYKRDLAMTRYAMLKETGNTDRDYTSSVSRTSYKFECEKNDLVDLKFDIYRHVKGFSIRPYLSKEAQTSYNFF